MSIRHFFTEPRFDWYQVTFIEGVDPWKVIESAYLHFEELKIHVAERVEVKQYNRALNAFLNGNRLFHFCLGGSGGDRPHIKATGAGSHQVYEWLRQEWQGAYAVARCDVCMDTTEPEMFDYLYKTQSKFANDEGISQDQAGDWLVPGSPAGRTFYVGSRKKGSQAHTRTYEKGKQLDATNKDWVRFEVELKPQRGVAKREVALLTPTQALFSVSWVRAMFMDMMHEHSPLDKAAFKTISTTWQPNTLQKSLIALVKQYGRVLEQFAEGLPGGWHDVGEGLQEIAKIHGENKRAKGGLGLNPYDELLTRLLRDAA